MALSITVAAWAGRLPATARTIREHRGVRRARMRGFLRRLGSRASWAQLGRVYRNLHARHSTGARSIRAGCCLVLRLFLLAFEQRALALDAPAVARQRAIGAHHAVAGNRHRQRVGRAGAGHGARAAGDADARGQLGVADRAARPGCCAAPATRAAGRRCRARPAASPGRCAALRPGRPPAPPSARTPASAPSQLGLRKAVLQVAQQHVRVVADQDRADARVRSPPPGSRPASMRRWRSGSRRRCPPARKCAGVMPSTACAPA